MNDSTSVQEVSQYLKYDNKMLLQNSLSRGELEKQGAELSLIQVINSERGYDLFMKHLATEFSMECLSSVTEFLHYQQYLYDEYFAHVDTFDPKKHLLKYNLGSSVIEIPPQVPKSYIVYCTTISNDIYPQLNSLSPHTSTYNRAIKNFFKNKMYSSNERSKSTTVDQSKSVKAPLQKRKQFPTEMKIDYFNTPLTADIQNPNDSKRIGINTSVEDNSHANDNDNDQPQIQVKKMSSTHILNKKVSSSDVYTTENELSAYLLDQSSEELIFRFRQISFSLFEKYINPNSCYELNIRGETRRKLQYKMSDRKKWFAGKDDDIIKLTAFDYLHLFDDSCKEVFQLLQDSFRRFQQTLPCKALSQTLHPHSNNSSLL
ncbi:hypothetical protein RFI_13511 [Reticulomyxa filosa]|uniref:RGS domain-containing protein n=1 Tax=Reticulomyxa filosa TaxID=46433 RepID=X6NCC2_RETFI|nr:hypothetical protein RFI_13511 [Reticulomyxa filosa]|eukprot:ETO23666.1 hypothetical protein RFI_13511 [Reticulomyxa filosa]